MNNTKIGGRISEIDIIKFLLQKFNENHRGIKFKMGLNDDLFWYRPYYSQSKYIDEEYTFNEDTYQQEKSNFIPVSISIGDMGLSANLDFINGSASTTTTFYIPIENFKDSEFTRYTIEDIRDTLRQGFFIQNVTQRAFNKTDKPTTKSFKFLTNTGTISYNDIETINGKQFITCDLEVDIEFSDMEHVGNQVMWEMAYKLPNGSYSAYERVYPITNDIAMAYGGKDKQELPLYISDKTFTSSNLTAYNNATIKYDFDEVTIGSLDVQNYEIGSVIRIKSNKQWSTSTVGGTYVLDLLNESITSSSNLVSYLNQNYPASNYDVGEKARGNAGSIPLTYYYAIVSMGSITTYSYYIVTSATVSKFAESKSMETQNTSTTKAFSIVMDFTYRKQYSTETVGIISRLFKDIVQKRYGYRIYKIKMSFYDYDGTTWTIDNELSWERVFIISSESTLIALGSNIPFRCSFIVSNEE